MYMPRKEGRLLTHQKEITQRPYRILGTDEGFKVVKVESHVYLFRLRQEILGNFHGVFFFTRSIHVITWHIEFIDSQLGSRR